MAADSLGHVTLSCLILGRIGGVKPSHALCLYLALYLLIWGMFKRIVKS